MAKHLFSGIEHPLRASFEGDFILAETSTAPTETVDKDECERQLAETVQRLDAVQHVFYADGRRALLLIFQALDAAGKDSTIRAVLSGVDPSGCSVHAFKQPSREELAHDFLWRAVCRLPERGRIGVFNRSYYEDVLVARVHPHLVATAGLQAPRRESKLWKERFDSIRAFEKHLARNGTLIVKFFLHLSQAEQRRRFLSRLQEPQKNWKFDEGDLRERALWGDYQHAYQDMINATSRRHAPWYVIPADDKPFMRATVAQIIADTLKAAQPRYPTINAAQRRRFTEMQAILEADS